MAVDLKVSPMHVERMDDVEGEALVDEEHVHHIPHPNLLYVVAVAEALPETEILDCIPVAPDTLARAFLPY